MNFSVCIHQKLFPGESESTRVLHDLNFDVPSRTILGIYGPSGCGKSTALRIMAGLDQDYDGSVLLDGELVRGPKRDIGLVVQTQVCFEWLTVSENLTFGLRYSDSSKIRSATSRVLGIVDRDEERFEAERLAKLVGLRRVDLNKYPRQISGGMKQRMAFGRALCLRPKILLLDEPFSSLDVDSRESLQDVVLNVRDETGVSFVCVSHDPEEVLYLSDKIICFGGTPATIAEVLHPKFSKERVAELRFTPEFQSARKNLQSKLGTLSYNERKENA